MADLSAVLQALVQADQEAKANSPYAGVSNFTNQMAPTILQAAGSGQYKPGESIAAGLINGLVGGFSEGLNDKYASKQNDLAYQAMSNAMLGNGATKPEGINRSVFAPIRAAGSVFNIANSLEDQNTSREAQNELQKAITTETIKGAFSNPYRAKKAQEVIAQMFGQQPAAARGVVEDVVSDAQPMVQQGAIGDGPRSFESYLDQTQGDEALARSLYERDLTKPDRMFEDAESLRKEFNALPEVQDFKTVSTGYRALVEAMKDPAGTSDFEIIRRAAQAVEPGLAVRKDDQDSIEAAPSLFGSYAAQVQGALSGKTRLTDDVRAGLMRIAERSFNTNAQAFNKTREFYQNRLVDRGLDPISLSPLEEAQTVSMTPTNYTREQLSAAGYSDSDIKELISQGLVK